MQTRSCRMPHACCFLRSNVHTWCSAYYPQETADGHRDLKNSLSLRCWIGRSCCCFALSSLFQSHLYLNPYSCYYPCKYAARNRRPCTSLEDQRQCSHPVVEPSSMPCSPVLACRRICSSSCRIK
jgi:hypothetical protein